MLCKETKGFFRKNIFCWSQKNSLGILNRQDWQHGQFFFKATISWRFLDEQSLYSSLGLSQSFVQVEVKQRNRWTSKRLLLKKSPNFKLAYHIKCQTRVFSPPDRCCWLPTGLLNLIEITKEPFFGHLTLFRFFHRHFSDNVFLSLNSNLLYFCVCVPSKITKNEQFSILPRPVAGLNCYEPCLNEEKIGFFPMAGFGLRAYNLKGVSQERLSSRHRLVTLK